MLDRKLTLEDHVRDIISRTPQIENWHFEVGETHICETLGIVLQCGGQMLNVTLSFSSARGIQWLGFA